MNTYYLIKVVSRDRQCNDCKNIYFTNTSIDIESLFYILKPLTRYKLEITIEHDTWKSNSSLICTIKNLMLEVKSTILYKEKEVLDSEDVDYIEFVGDIRHIPFYSNWSNPVYKYGRTFYEFAINKYTDLISLDKYVKMLNRDLFINGERFAVVNHPSFKSSFYFRGELFIKDGYKLFSKSIRNELVWKTIKVEAYR